MKGLLSAAQQPVDHHVCSLRPCRRVQNGVEPLHRCAIQEDLRGSEAAGVGRVHMVFTDPPEPQVSNLQFLAGYRFDRCARPADRERGCRRCSPVAIPSRRRLGSGSDCGGRSVSSHGPHQQPIARPQPRQRDNSGAGVASEARVRIPEAPNASVKGQLIPLSLPLQTDRVRRPVPRRASRNRTGRSNSREENGQKIVRIGGPAQVVVCLVSNTSPTTRWASSYSSPLSWAAAAVHLAQDVGLPTSHMAVGLR